MSVSFDLLKRNQTGLSIATIPRVLPQTAVQRLTGELAGFEFENIRVQPKMKISQPNEIYEQEADRVAEQVTAGMAPAASRENLPAVDDGAPGLDHSIRKPMESHFRHEFSNIRIHNDDQAHRSAQAIDALAYTIGSDIFFARNQYTPATQRGKMLLAHELTHVVQQQREGKIMVQRQQAVSGLGMRNQPGGLFQESGNPLILSSSQLNQILRESEAPIHRWLDANINNMRILSVNAVVRRIYQYVPEAASMSRGNVEAAVRSWAANNGIVLPRLSAVPDPADVIPPAPARPSIADSEIVSRIRSAFKVIVNGLGVERAHGFAKITATGPTVGLRGRGGFETSGTVSWGGAMGIQTSYRDFHFSGEISADRWELNFSYPVEDPVPDLSSLSKVFREGESAMSNIAQEIPRFGSLADVSSISDAVKPHLQPVKDAVQAVQGIAGVQAGRVMFGLSASGPGIGQRPTTTSIEVTATITVTF